MSKTLFAFITAVFVVAVLAGGTAFIMQQNKLSEFRRLALQAEEKINTNSPDEAIPLLKRVESQGGTDRSSFLLGRIYFERGDFTQALEWFRHLQEKYPRSDYVAQALLYEGRHALEVENNPGLALERFLQVLSRYPKSDAADFALLHLARLSYDKGDVAQARKNLDQILKKPSSPARNEAEFLLGDINMKALYGPDPQPGDEIYTIQRGDRLAILSRKLGVPVDLIIAINKVDPRSLSIGRQLKIPRLNLSIVVDKSERTLTLKNNNQLLKKYHVGINRNERAIPEGNYVITSKVSSPEYIDPDTGQSIKAGAPGNPLGTRQLTLRRDISIHGTNAPETVGKYTNRGWISMKNEDVEELYGLVQADKTPVTIRGRIPQEESSPGNSR